MIDNEEDSSETILEIAPINTKKPRVKKVYRPSDEICVEMIKELRELKKTIQKIIVLSIEAHDSVKKDKKKLSKYHNNEDDKTSKPRGFALPTTISNDLYQFIINEMKVKSIQRTDKSSGQTQTIMIDKNVLLARHEIVTLLCTYFQEHGLRKNAKDKRDIYLDPLLVTLFKINVNDFKEKGGRVADNGDPIITYFDLQKYLSQHCGSKSQQQQQ